MTCKPHLLAAVLAAVAFATAAPAAEPLPASAGAQTVSLAGDALVRQAAFVYRVTAPEKPGSRTIVLMHGSGGNESTLVSLASRIDPAATLIGIRGRIVQDGVTRWYRRLTPTEFDQQDVRAEAAALVEFLDGLAREHGLDLSGVTFLGYSNGANLIAALSILHPDLIHRAVLLRAMPVLAEAPKADLSRTRFLTIAGEKDKTYFPFAPRLSELLRERGASVETRVIAAGHGVGDEDAAIVAEWLGSPVD